MQKIKITIGDRVYPLSVTEGQEAFLRNSAKQIEQMMKHYQQNYAVQDKQDVLAMCALQLALQLRQEEAKSSESSEEIDEKLRTIDTLLSEITQKIRSLQYTACTGFIFDKLNTNSIRRGEFKLQKQATFESILEQFGSLKPVYFRVYTKLYWCGLF